MSIKKDTLSNEQKAELERLRPFIARQGLILKMNGSNWRVALNAIIEIVDYPSSYRVRCVRDTQDPPANTWQGPLPQGLPLYNFIEWMELNPRPVKGRDFTKEIKHALTTAGIPCTETPSGIRIIGYQRPN